MSAPGLDGSAPSGANATLHPVFDLGGVVFRWQPDEFMTRLLPHHAPDRAAGKAFAASFFQGFGGAWGDFDRGRIEEAPLAAGIAARLGLRPEEARHIIDSIPDELQPIPETAALLRRLHGQGRRLFYLSNMPRPYASHLEATHDVLGLFERGVFSSRVGIIKPEPEVFAHAAEAFGIAPQSLLLIDDMEGNVRAARAAGWQALHFLDAQRCEAELMPLLAR